MCFLIYCCRSKGKLNVPLMYLHRFLRLTPVLAMAILVYMKVLPLMGSGPLFKTFSKYVASSCEETWFWTILYLQNYVVPNKTVGCHLSGVKQYTTHFSLSLSLYS